MSGFVHIYAPQPTARSIWSGKCLDCQKRTRFAGVCTPWYGWDSTCLRCGRTWQDGEWTPLDFVRGSRAKSIEAAKRRYRRCVPEPAVASERSEESSPRQAASLGPGTTQTTAVLRPCAGDALRKSDGGGA